MNEIPEPEDFSEKETCAFFGLAAYNAQVLEKGLVNMVTVFDTVGLRITRKEFDDLFAKYDSKTIGQLLRAAREKSIPIPQKTSELLDEAQKRRNYLNHDFFADHAGHFMSEDGRRVMIQRLIELTRLFRAADRAAEKIYQPIMAKMGLTEEQLAKHAAELVEKAKRECA